MSLHLDRGKETEHWSTPVTNQIKVNVDGAIFEVDGRFGMGCLDRGSDGRMLQAFIVGKVCSVQPEIAEIIGIKEALSWIDGHFWSNVVMETDSLVCVQDIKNTLFMPSQFGLLVQDCRDSLKSKCNITLRFVKRSANKAAHYLARGSCFSPDHVLQPEDCSAELHFIVMGDYSL